MIVLINSFSIKIILALFSFHLGMFSCEKHTKQYDDSDNVYKIISRLYDRNVKPIRFPTPPRTVYYKDSSGVMKWISKKDSVVYHNALSKYDIDKRMVVAVDTTFKKPGLDNYIFGQLYLQRF